MQAALWVPGSDDPPLSGAPLVHGTQVMWAPGCGSIQTVLSSRHMDGIANT